LSCDINGAFRNEGTETTEEKPMDVEFDFLKEAV
jgi:hypothetical protein